LQEQDKERIEEDKQKKKLN